MPRNVGELAIGMAGMAMVIALAVYAFGAGDTRDFANWVLVGTLVAVGVGSWRGARPYPTWTQRLEAGTVATMLVVAFYAAEMVIAIIALGLLTHQGCGVTATGPCDVADLAAHVVSAFEVVILLSVILAIVSTIRARKRT